MQRIARKLIRRMAKQSDGYIPNLGGLAVRPGSILTKRFNRYDLNGALWKRVAEAGDAALADALEAATNRVDPANSTGDVQKHKLGLKYWAGTTQLIASPIGFDIKVSDVTVKANVKIEFGGRSDYLFDTTEPSPWYTFNDIEMGLIRSAALKYLRSGEYVVIGTVVAKKYIWYISREANTTIALSASGGADLDNLSVDKLADLSASVGLNTVVNSTSVWQGHGENGVAAFRVLGKRHGLAKYRDEGRRRSVLVSVGDKAFDVNEIDGVLSDPDEDELVELVDPGDDED